MLTSLLSFIAPGSFGQIFFGILLSLLALVLLAFFTPFVDARLADGSRVNAIVPPLALDGSLLSIRKFSHIPINMAKLVEYGSVPSAIAQVLEGVVKARRNILISGGTGSGKTTLLNAISAFIDGREIDLGTRQKALYEKYREKYRQLGILE